MIENNVFLLKEKRIQIIFKFGTAKSIYIYLTAKTPPQQDTIFKP